MLFPTLKKIGVKKCSGGGGGGGGSVGRGDLNLFLEKQFFLISCFMLFSTLKKYIETPVRPSVTFSLLAKWEVVSPNSRSGQLESISMISSIPLTLF